MFHRAQSAVVHCPSPVGGCMPHRTGAMQNPDFREHIPSTPSGRKRGCWFNCANTPSTRTGVPCPADTGRCPAIRAGTSLVIGQLYLCTLAYVYAQPLGIVGGVIGR